MVVPSLASVDASLLALVVEATSVVLGDESVVLGDASVVLGDDSVVLGDDSVVLGDASLVLSLSPLPSVGSTAFVVDAASTETAGGASVQSNGAEENIDHGDSTPEKLETEEYISSRKEHQKPTTIKETKSEQDIQIPVAVVYEPEAPYYHKSRPKIQRVSSKRRKVQNPTLVEPTVVEKQIEEGKKTKISAQENENTLNSRVPDKKERFSNNEKRQLYNNTNPFIYSYEGGDGTKAFEKGQLKTFDDDNAGEAVSGSFSYTAKDGNEYSLSYTADENGYRPVGAHLPTPPPIPPAIARALAYLATKPTAEPVTKSLFEADYS
ncbi:hypothetical protein MSG28_007510 [Choristoneura fumiferana]|uniref:Uncharacterized protein n=1 Tax=Choristoneura fumiferana TaxID=7141 RepID=A0ACC0JY39_CHOFU|nr:hypothetical protein MSG28_007510 [Choristoneura fumiferana]